MDTTTETPVLTTDKAKAAITLELTRQELAWQSLQSEGDTLLFNEDQESIDAAKMFLNKLKKVGNAIDSAHEKGKAPAWKECTTWDEARRSFVSILKEIETPLAVRFRTLCNTVERKRVEKAEKEAKDTAIRQGVESNILTFASRIAEAKTFKELTLIESSINLQKTDSAKAKYGDLHGEAIALYDAKLLPLLKDQKEKVRELEKNAEDLKKAEAKGDGEALSQLQDKAAILEDGMQENKVRVQETALGVNFAVPKVVETIAPTVKARRTTIKAKIVDMETAIKKSLDLLVIELDQEKAKAVAKTLSDAGTFLKAEFIIVNGIEYRVEKTY